MAAVRNIQRLIDSFSSHTTLPVDPDDVRDEILSYGIKDEIEFVGVDIDKRVMYGAFHQYIRRDSTYGEQIVHVDIYWDRQLARDWKRLVCCKELLHMLDPSVSKTATRQDCENLVSHLSDPSLMDAPFSEEKMQAWSDELMMFYAMAVLLPWDARESLYLDYRTDNSRLAVIAKSVDLPDIAVRLVLSDHWPRLYEVLGGSK